jgi:hypothetical protein
MLLAASMLSMGSKRLFFKHSPFELAEEFSSAMDDEAKEKRAKTSDVENDKESRLFRHN